MLLVPIHFFYDSIISDFAIFIITIVYKATKVDEIGLTRFAIKIDFV